MTRNQIDFQKHLEQKRHNAELEAQGRSGLFETTRSNKAREFETHRSNVANEQELRRSHLVNEAETERSNRERESVNRQNAGTALKQLVESQRSNMRNEDIRQQQADDLQSHYAYSDAVANRTSSSTSRLNQSRANLTDKDVNTYEIRFILDEVNTGLETVGNLLRGGSRWID